MSTQTPAAAQPYLADGSPNPYLTASPAESLAEHGADLSAIFAHDDPARPGNGGLPADDVTTPRCGTVFGVAVATWPRASTEDTRPAAEPMEVILARQALDSYDSSHLMDPETAAGHLGQLASAVRLLLQLHDGSTR